MTKAEATTLGDRYRLDVHRASLPFGDLWEADDTQGARVLVLLSPPQQSNPDEQAMAAVEASGAVSSPNAVGWTDGGSTEEDRFWLAAPLVGHTSFSEAVAEHDGVTTEEGARLVHQVARAVTAAEQASQHHHALCGDLIRLVERTDGEGTAVKVYGWGLEGLLPPYKPLRRHDPFLGVPDYMAPELCRGREGTESADVYALGTLLYEAVRGRPPFSARTASASASTTMKRQIYENPLALHVRYGDLSHIKSYESVTLRALSKQPSHRPNDAASLAQELEDFLAEAGDAPVPEDQVPTGESGRVRDRRTQVLSGLAGQARAVQKEVDAQGEATSPEDAAEATGGSGSSSSGGGDQPTTGGKRGSATKRRKRKRKYSGRVDHHADTMIFDAVPGGAEASSEAAGASSSETSGEEPVETATSDGGTPESASDSEATKGAGQAADDASAHETVVDSPTVSGAEEAGEARSEEAAEAGGEEAAEAGGEEAAEAGGEEAAEAEGEEAAEAAQAEAPAKPDEGGPEGASEDATVAELRETAAKEAEAPRDRREEQPTAVEFPGVDPDQDVDDQWFVDAAEDLSSHQAPEDTFDAEKGTAHSLRFWSIASIVTLVLIGAVYALVDAGGSGPSSEPTRAKLEAPGSREARGGGAREGSSEGAAAAADRDEEESDERGIDDSVRNELRRQALLGEDDDEPGRTAGEEIGKLAARREGASGQQRGAPSDDDRAGAGGTAGASDDRDETGGGGGDSDGPSDGEDGAAAAAAGDGSGSREGAGSGASETTGGDGDDEETAGQPDRGDDAAGSSTGAEARRQKQAEADEKAQERKKAEDDKAEEPKKAEAEDDKAETEDDEAEEPKKAEAEDDEAEEPKKAEAEDDKADDEGGGSEEESTEDKSRRYIKLGIKAYKAGNYELASGYFEKAQKLDDGNRVAAKYLKMARSKMEDE